MSSKKILLDVSYHDDDDTGMYHIGEIDFGVHGILENYIKKYGITGVESILATLGHLAWEVKNIYFNTKQPIQDAQAQFNGSSLSNKTIHLTKTEGNFK